jgi:mRNA interferase MazF
MTPFEPGDVVLVRFPFTDLTTIKKRPAVIISPPDFAPRHEDVVLVALTSRPQADAELALADWRAAGLPKETWFKPLIGTISAGLVERRLGRLTPDDRVRVSWILRRLIAPIFMS